MTGISAVIPAAGRGERFGRGSNKVFAQAAGKPLLAHTLGSFEQCGLVDDIVLVVAEHEIGYAREIAERYGIYKLRAVGAGGGHRQESVERGLLALDSSTNIVAVHDGARPLVHQETIRATIETAREMGAAVAATPVIDTIKMAGMDGIVTATPDRSTLWSIQTPQTFEKSLLLQAYRQADADGYLGTDDASLVERLGHPVKLVQGSYDNIKVTTPLDLEFVEMMLGGKPPVEARTGFGYDIHRFEPGRRLMLGGVEFPGEDGLKGHSDADVILHAISDAILGAAALGDIGRHFPDTDEQYRGISSIFLLEQVASVLKGAGWSVVNVDATLVAERPKIAKRVPEMQKKIAAAIGVDPERVSIKATTAEKLGDIGAGSGAACYAVATVKK
ncbi:MAG: 2-C-methyl-D-erythritol 4-phosphate cytidylyltransferase [Armatimonadota bacterium]